VSASTAIGMVSASLRSLLLGEMRLNPALDVTILAPDEQAGSRRVNLFLYKLAENEYLRNAEVTVRPGNPNQLIATPMSLKLYYLLTPYAPNDPETGNATAHQILGEAMRIFYENPVVPPTYLDPGLADAREELRLTLKPLDPEELSWIWHTFDQPFRLSVLYEVSTVQLDRLPTSQRPMAPRVRRVGVPGVQAPMRPPAVTDLTPQAGQAGATLTFTGTHLDGWRARVLLGGRVIEPGLALTGDAFTVPTPGDLLAGFYEVVVEVSGLFRRTFLYEVTP